MEERSQSKKEGKRDKGDGGNIGFEIHDESPE